MNYTYQRAIPPRQAAVLEFIRREVGVGGRFPHAGSIARYMGWTDDRVHDCLERLVFRGAVIRSRARLEDKRRRYVYSLPQTTRDAA